METMVRCCSRLLQNSHLFQQTLYATDMFYQVLSILVTSVLKDIRNKWSLTKIQHFYKETNVKQLRSCKTEVNLLDEREKRCLTILF